MFLRLILSQDLEIIMPARTRESMIGKRVRGQGKILKRKRQDAIRAIRVHGERGEMSQRMFQAGQQAVVRRLTPEKKNFNVALTFTIDSTSATSSTAATGQLLVGLVQGIASTERIGKHIQVKRIQVRANLNYAPGAAAGGCNNADMWLIYDRQPNGAQATWAEIMSDAGVGRAAFALLSTNYEKRFKVLYHKHVDMVPPAGVTTAWGGVLTHMDIDLPVSLDVEYTSTLGAITELTQANLFFAFGSSSDNTTTVTGNSRITYFDV